MNEVCPYRRKMEGEKEGRSMWTPERCEGRQNGFLKKTEKFKCRFPSVAFPPPSLSEGKTQMSKFPQFRNQELYSI